MRIRSIKPEFYRDEITGLMACDVGLFYLGLCGFADDAGNFEWNAALIRADLDPYDAKWGGTKGIETQLANLDRLGRIRRYDSGGRPFGQIVSFLKHQHPQRPAYRCPAPSTGGVQEEYGSEQGEIRAVVVVGSGSGEGSGGVADAAAGDASLPAPKYPNAKAVWDCAQANCGMLATPDAALWATVEAEAVRAGVAACVAEVDKVAARQRAKGKAIGSLVYFVKALQALPGIGDAPRGKATLPAADHSAFGTQTHEVKL